MVSSYDNKLVKSYEFNLIFIKYFFIIYFLVQLLNMNFTIITIVLYI